MSDQTKAITAVKMIDENKPTLEICDYLSQYSLWEEIAQSRPKFFESNLVVSGINITFEALFTAAMNGAKLNDSCLRTLFSNHHIAQLVHLVSTERPEYLAELLGCSSIKEASPAMWRDILKLPNSREYSGLIQLCLQNKPRSFLLDIVRLNVELRKELLLHLSFTLSLNDWIELLKTRKPEVKAHMLNDLAYVDGVGRQEYIRLIVLDKDFVEWAENVGALGSFWAEDWFKLLSITTNADETAVKFKIWKLFEKGEIIKLLLKSPERICNCYIDNFTSDDWFELILSNPAFLKDYAAQDPFSPPMTVTQMNAIAQKYPEFVKQGKFQIYWENLDSETLRVFENHLTKQEKINAGLEGKTLKEIYHG